MIHKSILRLKDKILKEDARSMPIYDQDREAMKAIIKYYNETSQIALQNNELLHKCLIYMLTSCFVQFRGKADINKTVKYLSKKITEFKTDHLIELLSQEIDLSEYTKLCHSVGIDLDKIETNETDLKALEANKEKFYKLLNNPFTRDQTYAMLNDLISELIIQDKAKQKYN